MTESLSERKLISKFPQNNDRKSAKGFTLIELLITISITTMLMSVVLFDYGRSNDRLAVSGAAQELALAIRQAQTYGINVREAAVWTLEFNRGFGVYLDPSADAGNYYIFADKLSSENQIYNPGFGCGAVETECVQRLSLRNGVTITAIGSNNPCPSDNETTSMSIYFKRPNPDALIHFVNNAGVIMCASQTYGVITLTSPKGVTKNVIIQATGQVYVQ